MRPLRGDERTVYATGTSFTLICPCNLLWSMRPSLWQEDLVALLVVPQFQVWWLCRHLFSVCQALPYRLSTCVAKKVF